MWRAAIILSLTIACSSLPEINPEPCTIYSREDAICTPPRGAEYDRPLSEMRGYMCFSPDDTADIKTFIEILIKELDKIENKVR